MFRNKLNRKMNEEDINNIFYKEAAEVTKIAVKNMNRTSLKYDAPYELKLVPHQEHPNYHRWKLFFDIYLADD